MPNCFSCVQLFMTVWTLLTCQEYEQHIEHDEGRDLEVNNFKYFGK